jgi:hypothetical protein
MGSGSLIHMAVAHLLGKVLVLLLAQMGTSLSEYMHGISWSVVGCHLLVVHLVQGDDKGFPIASANAVRRM